MLNGRLFHVEFVVLITIVLLAIGAHADDNYEPNDSYVDAWDFSTQEYTWLQNINGPAEQWDNDYYEIYVDSGFERVQAEAAFFGAASPVRVFLMTATGGLVGEFEASGSYNLVLDRVVPAGGDSYFILVQGRAGDQDANSGIMYDLRWDDLLAPSLEVSVGSLHSDPDVGNNAAPQSFEIWLSGSETYCSISEGASWISSVSPGAIADLGTGHQTIEVTYNTSGLDAGNYYTTINIDAGGSGQISLPVNLTVASRIITLEAIPESNGGIEFGSVQVGSSMTQRVMRIHCSGTDLTPMTVSSISYPSGFSGNWSGGQISAGSYRDVLITFQPTAEKVYSGDIVVNSDATSGANTISVSGTGTAPTLSSISISGATNVNESGGAQYTCTAYYSDDSSATVTPDWSQNSGYASISSAGYLTTYSVSSDQSCTITAGYDGKIDTHGVTIKNIEVPAVTRIISLSGNLAFGAVPTGSSATRTLTISNSGNETLEVASISYPSGFSGSWSGPISAGGSQDVTVTFSPTAATSYIGNLSVDANETSGANTRAVSGTGASVQGGVPQDIPYVQDFSSGQPSAAAGWDYYSNNEGRIEVASGSLRMDDSVNGSLYSLNEAVLHLNLSGKSGVFVEFDHTEYSEDSAEDTALPASFTGHYDGDGVSFSADGTTWYRLINLADSFTDRSCDLDAAVQAAGISYSSDFRIKFQQHDNWPMESDGRSFDNIVVQIPPTGIIRLVGDLAFGNVKVGSISNRTLTIYNDGIGDLSFSSITYPSGFSCDWSWGTVAGGGSQSVTMTFFPSSVASYGGTLTVNSDASSGVNTLAVSGTGMAYPNTPTLSSPASGVTGQTLMPTLAASAFSDPGGLSHANSQWQVDNDYFFSSPEWDSGTSYVAGTQVTVPSGRLIHTSSYYWRVRYRNSAGMWSDWSSPREFSTATSANSIVLEPTADAHVISHAPDLNAGFSPYLSIGVGMGSTYYAHVKWDIAGAPDLQGSQIQNVRMRIGQNGDGSTLVYDSDLVLSRITGPWLEPEVTYNTRPASTDFAMGAQRVRGFASSSYDARWVDLPDSGGKLRDYVQAVVDGTAVDYGIALRGDTVNAVVSWLPFLSRENTSGYTPQLIIDYISNSLLAPENGGKLESYTSQYSSTAGSASNLTDGIRSGTDWNWCWFSAYAPTVPQEFVYSFDSGQVATLSRVAFYNYGQGSENRYSKDYSIYVSNDASSWSLIKSGTLEAREGAQSIPLSGSGKYLKVVITSGYDSSFWQLGEIEAFGSLAPPVVDNTAPVAGTASSPTTSSSSMIAVTYSGALDAGGSGLSSVELWYKKGAAGSWTDSGLRETGTSGSFDFAGMTGSDTYYFDLVAVDGSGNRSAAASGVGDCNTVYTAPAVQENLLLAANGGRLESFASEYSATAGAAANLTDGLWDNDWNHVWFSAYAPTAPQEFVYSFENGQAATLSRIDFYNYGQGMNRYSKGYSVYVSSDASNWSLIKSGTLAASEGVQSVSVSGSGAYLKVVITSGYDSSFWQMGEIEAYGKLTEPGDTDGDSLPDAWETEIFGGIGSFSGSDDPDQDGLTNLGEWRAGTNPTNAASVLRVEEVLYRAVFGNVISWQSVSGKTYTCELSTNLMQGFSVIHSNIIGQPSTSSCTDTVSRTPPVYYRIILE